MGLTKAAIDAVGSTFADQWKEIIVPSDFNERTLVVPGVLKNTVNGRGSNLAGTEGVISDGSIIYVPEKSAAVVLNQAGVEDIVFEAGGYEYRLGQDSVFDGNSIRRSIVQEAKERIGFGGISADEKRIVYVNLREMRGIRFGTSSPIIYHDKHYGADLEVIARGSFSVKVVDVAILLQNFVPPNSLYYSLDERCSKDQLTSEFLQSLTVAINLLSSKYRISQLPSMSSEVSRVVAVAGIGAATWPDRFGLEPVGIAIENIELSDNSRDLVEKFSADKMSLGAFEEASQHASDIAAQQKIAEGVRDFGLGDVGGMVLGANVAQGIGVSTRSSQGGEFDNQIEAVRKLKALLDEGVLSREEFDIKKKEIMGL